MTQSSICSDENHVLVIEMLLKKILVLLLSSEYKKYQSM